MAKYKVLFYCEIDDAEDEFEATDAAIVMIEEQNYTGSWINYVEAPMPVTTALLLAEMTDDDAYPQSHHDSGGR